MSEPFIGEIRIFAGNFAPQGWLLCNGQQMLVSQYSPLSAVIGTIYGGDGITYFNLPNLQGYAPMNQGQGTGLSNRAIGKSGGIASVTLSQPQIPSHTHTAIATNAAGTSNDPTGRIWATKAGIGLYSTKNDNPVGMNVSALGTSGSQSPHDNVQPYLGINFAIAWDGVFPIRP